MRVVAVGHEIGNFSVAVASDILNGSISSGAFVKPLDGHDGEELVDGPGVGERLEQREVAEILVCQQFVDVHQFLGNVLKALGEDVDFMTYAPVHGLYFGARL